MAGFARNIPDAPAFEGGIDSGNLTGFVNEPRSFGREVKAKF